MLSGQWQASDVNLKRSMVSILTKSTLWPGNLEAISWCVCVCVCLCVCVCVCVCACAHACVCGELYKYIFSPELCQYQKKRRGGVPACRDGKRWGDGEESANTKEEEESRGREPCVYYKNNLLSQSVLVLLLLLRQRRKYAQRVFFLFLSLSQTSCWQALPGVMFFQQGSVRVLVDEQGCECLHSEMDRGSSTLQKSPFPSAPAEVIRQQGWATPPSDCDAVSKGGSLASGGLGLHSHDLTEVCGASLLFCVFSQGPCPLRIPKAVKSIFKISILLWLINLSLCFVACDRWILVYLLFVLFSFCLF